MKLLACLLLACLPSAHAFNKDFNLVNDRSPLEFNLLFESLKNQLKESQEQLRLIVLAQHINKGLGPLKKDQSFFLLKSEIYKTLLEWPHAPTQFPVGSHTLTRLKATLEKNKSIYTPFSTWVVEALIADLENFEKGGVLSLTPNERSSLSGEKAQLSMKMQRVLKYSRGWIEQADTLSAQDFNHLTKRLAWRTLERVKAQAQLFQRFSSQALEETSTNTFNIPEQAMPRPKEEGAAPRPLGPEKGLAERAQDAKDSAEASMKKLDVAPQGLPAEELSGAIDQIDEPTTSPGGGAPAPVPAQKSGGQPMGAPGLSTRPVENPLPSSSPLE